MKRPKEESSEPPTASLCCLAGSQFGRNHASLAAAAKIGETSQTQKRRALEPDSAVQLLVYTGEAALLCHRLLCVLLTGESFISMKRTTVTG